MAEPRSEKISFNIYDASERSVPLDHKSVPDSLFDPPAFQVNYSSKSVTRTDIRVESKEAVAKSRCFELHDLLRPEECSALIRALEQIGFEEHSDVRHEYPADYRSNSRIIIIDEKLASTIWARLIPHLKGPDVAHIKPIGFAANGTWLPIAVNDCFLFSRYSEGQFFKPHYDGQYKNALGDCSIFTITIYLNDDFEGGRVFFLDEADKSEKTVLATYQPSRGSALLFNHDSLHEGEMVNKGAKYLLRTSIMFRCVQNLTSHERPWLKNPDWLRMADLFNAFDQLSLDMNAQDFTSKYLECQSIQLAAGRSIPTVEPLPLPDEIFSLIFMNVPAQDLFSSFSVSKAWRALARNGRFWQARIEADFDIGLNTILASDPVLSVTDPDLIDWFSFYRRMFHTKRAVDVMCMFPCVETLYTRNLDSGDELTTSLALVRSYYDRWDRSFISQQISDTGDAWCCDLGDPDGNTLAKLASITCKSLAGSNESGRTAVVFVYDPIVWADYDPGVSEEDSRERLYDNITYAADGMQATSGLFCAVGAIDIYRAALAGHNLSDAIIINCHRMRPATGDWMTAPPKQDLVLHTHIMRNGIVAHEANCVIPDPTLVSFLKQTIEDLVKQYSIHNIILLTDEEERRTRLEDRQLDPNWHRHIILASLRLSSNITFETIDQVKTHLQTKFSIGLPVKVLRGNPAMIAAGGLRVAMCSDPGSTENIWRYTSFIFDSLKQANLNQETIK